MATLMPSLSSDEEENKVESESEEEQDDDADEVNHDFSFGGILVSCRKYRNCSFFTHHFE